MSGPLRVCREPGCPELVPFGACRRHDRSRDPGSSRNHRGVARQARGHGAAYDRAARGLRGLPCEVRFDGCMGVATGGDYTIPGDWSSPLRPACARCQNVQGGRLARRRSSTSPVVGATDAPGPGVIRIVGAPASGKSHLRLTLAARLGLPSFAIDDERIRILRPAEVWPEDDGPAWYRLRRAVTTEAPCIVETSGLSWSEAWLYDGAAVYTVLCHADPVVRRRRLVDRVADGHRLARTRDYVARLMDLPEPDVKADATWPGGDSEPVAAAAAAWLAARLVTA